MSSTKFIFQNFSIFFSGTPFLTKLQRPVHGAIAKMAADCRLFKASNSNGKTNDKIDSIQKSSKYKTDDHFRIWILDTRLISLAFQGTPESHGNISPFLWRCSGGITRGIIACFSVMVIPGERTTWRIGAIPWNAAMILIYSWKKNISRGAPVSTRKLIIDFNWIVMISSHLNRIMDGR